MGFQAAVGRCLRNYATFSGRARRSELWFFLLFNVLAAVAAELLDAVLFHGTGVFGLVVSLGLLLPGLAVGARRLHDTGRSGWWLLIGLVPVLGILLLIFFYVGPGERGANRFGPDPKGGPGTGMRGGDPAWGTPPGLSARLPARPSERPSEHPPERPWPVNPPPRS